MAHSTTTMNNAVETTTAKVLSVLNSYGVHSERPGSGGCDVLEEFLPMITKPVEAGQPVRIILPGFAFKAPDSENLVLGKLPDLGEELALAHLQGLCDNISAVYEHGAEMLICSDGLVYNDILGVSDEKVWEYGEAVRDIASTKKHGNLKFIRLWDLLEHDCPRDKTTYLQRAAEIRKELVHRHGDAQFDATAAVNSDKDWALIQAAYVADARTPEMVAKQMLHRGKAYAAAVRAARPEHIRLSIHDSVGKGKLSMTLIPHPYKRGTVGHMPWRSAVAVEADGSYRAVHPEEVSRTHELVHRDGRPYFFRFRSDLFDLSRESGLEVDIEHLYPCGIIVKPAKHSVHATPVLDMLSMEKLQKLSHHFSPIVLRGFGAATPEDEKGVEEKPDKLSLFCNSRLFFRYLPEPWNMERLEAATCKTADGNDVPLVVPHLVTNAKCLRWPPPCDAGTAKQPSPVISVEGNDGQELASVIEKLTHDFRVCLRFGKRYTDVVFNDDVTVLHA